VSDDGDRLVGLRQRIAALAQPGGALLARLREAAELLGEAASELGGEEEDAAVADFEAALQELGRALEDLAERLADLVAAPASEPGQRDRSSDST
jgi:hypothetical protein